MAPLIHPTRYFLRPNFALQPLQSFPIISGDINNNKTEYEESPGVDKMAISNFDLRGVTGPVLSAALPEPGLHLMLYTVVQVLAHENHIPKGFLNHTTWEPQEVPLLATKRNEWDEHQLVPWTGPEAVWVELTLNNIDQSGHPFHLVSRPKSGSTFTNLSNFQ